ncbi:hypothetical protein [Streptomyces sp. NPDC088727]|uniref:hypothetical protein n=1 Tax=Streptomyces sp. NPDC088727 TaxID=3365875 RepID=UPI0037F62925
MSSSNEIALPTYDFKQLEVQLQSDPNVNLGTLLSQLATIPMPVNEQPVAKKADPATAASLNAQLTLSIESLPKVFGKVELPATRRALRNSELALLVDEKEEISAAMKALKKREELVNGVVSTHFDVLAEKSGAAKADKTPVDKNGHYLIGGSSKEQRLEARTPGKDTFFVRERAKDQVEPSMDLLLKLYEEKEITRAEFLGLTKEVTYRELDEAKIRRGLLSKAKRARTQEIISRIGVVSYGVNSIKLRK